MDELLTFNTGPLCILWNTLYLIVLITLNFVDLGRDPYRTEHSWYCPNCEASYVSAEIETFLLDTVSRKFLAYNLQDLQCKKCNQVSFFNFTIVRISKIVCFTDQNGKSYKTLSLRFRLSLFNVSGRLC